MRFVRAFTLRDSGELMGIMEQETPFDHHSIDVPDTPGALEMHELGLAEHFDPRDLKGQPCSPAMHLFARMERTPGARGRGVAQFRAKAGREHEVPAFHQVPTAIDGVKALARAKGGAAIPERVAHWLEFMGSLSGDEMDEAALPRLTLERASEFDAMRTARDPNVGSRRAVFERQANERASLVATRAAIAAARRGS